MLLLCVGRHRLLSEHLARVFEEFGVDTVPCVGYEEMTKAAATHDPDAVVCDYDLLAGAALEQWERHAVLSSTPVIAVSLTRRPGEALLRDNDSIAGFLYLPTLRTEDARRLLASIRRKRSGLNPPNVLPWPGTTPVARLH